MSSGCVAPNLDTTRYSSPVPVIGLYIAAGSSVCLLSMLFDIISAYRRSQSWIPCRFFKLNSFTLTMLSIASKLQVDLTTPMPGVLDQLLKLTGTTLLCVCMGFFNLSVGNNGNSEYLSNMVALSIMIITVVVNICIQFYTGVIHLFIPEHIIIMCCMLFVLLLMWSCGRETNLRNKSDVEVVIRSLTKNLSSWKNVVLLERLKVCYTFGFDKNPQSRACRYLMNLTLVLLCLVCCCVLVEAIVRSVVLKQLSLCGGASDYDWSTWFILITQNLTIFLGCFAICFRLFTSFSFLLVGSDRILFVDDDVSMKKKFIAILGSPSCYKFGIFLQTSLYYVVNSISICVMLLPFVLFKIFGGKFHEEDMEFDNQIHGREEDENIYSRYLCKWTTEKVMNDIDKCVEESKRSAPKELLKLISRIRPSPKLRNFAPPDQMASPLPLAALVKTAITCIPEEASTRTLVLCFHEAIAILQAVIDPRDPDYGMFMRNPLLVDEDFDEFHRSAVDPDRFLYVRNPLLVDEDFDVRRSAFNPKRYLSNMSYGHKYGEVIKEIRNQWMLTDNLYGVIEQLFVDMLHSSFAELPNAIFKLATECPMDEYNERIRPVLVALHKIAPLEDYIKWSFPEKIGISSLISRPPEEVVATDDQNNRIEEDSDDNTSFQDHVVGVDHITMEIEEL